jgi:hypothetical protein
MTQDPCGVRLTLDHKESGHTGFCFRTNQFPASSFQVYRMATDTTSLTKLSKKKIKCAIPRSETHNFEAYLATGFIRQT